MFFPIVRLKSFQRWSRGGKSREASLGDQAAAAGKSKEREEETGQGRKQKQELQPKLSKGENTKLE